MTASQPEPAEDELEARLKGDLAPDLALESLDPARVAAVNALLRTRRPIEAAGGRVDVAFREAESDDGPFDFALPFSLADAKAGTIRAEARVSRDALILRLAERAAPIAARETLERLPDGALRLAAEAAFAPWLDALDAASPGLLITDVGPEETGETGAKAPVGPILRIGDAPEMRLASAPGDADALLRALAEPIGRRPVADPRGVRAGLPVALAFEIAEVRLTRGLLASLAPGDAIVLGERGADRTVRIRLVDGPDAIPCAASGTLNDLSVTLIEPFARRPGAPEERRAEPSAGGRPTMQETPRETPRDAAAHGGAEPRDASQTPGEGGAAQAPDARTAQGAETSTPSPTDADAAQASEPAATDATRTAPVSPPVSPPVASPAGGAIGDARLDDLDVPLVFEAGRLTVTAGELEGLTPGHVFTLERKVAQGVDVRVGERRIGRGKLVRIGDAVGVRLTRIFGREESRREEPDRRTSDRQISDRREETS